MEKHGLKRAYGLHPEERSAHANRPNGGLLGKEPPFGGPVPKRPKQEGGYPRLDGYAAPQQTFSDHHAYQKQQQHHRRLLPTRPTNFPTAPRSAHAAPPPSFPASEKSDIDFAFEEVDDNALLSLEVSAPPSPPRGALSDEFDPVHDEALAQLTDQSAYPPTGYHGGKEDALAMKAEVARLRAQIASLQVQNSQLMASSEQRTPHPLPVDTRRLQEEQAPGHLQKAQAEAKALQERAQEQARKLVESAKVEAQRLAEKARLDAKKLQEKAQDDVRQQQEEDRRLRQELEEKDKRIQSLQHAFSQARKEQQQQPPPSRGEPVMVVAPLQNRCARANRLLLHHFFVPCHPGTHEAKMDALQRQLQDLPRGPLLALLQTALRDLISHIDDFATHLLIGPLTSVLQEAMTHGKAGLVELALEMLYYAVFYAKGGKAKEKVPSALNEAWILRDTFQREDGVTEDTVLYWILQLHILLSASSAIPDACIVDYLALLRKDMLCDVLTADYPLEDMRVPFACLALARQLLAQPDLYWCFKDVDEHQGLRDAVERRPKQHLLHVAFQGLQRVLEKGGKRIAFGPPASEAERADIASSILTYWHHVHQLLYTVTSHQGGTELIIHSAILLPMWLHCLRIVHAQPFHKVADKQACCATSLKLLFQLCQSETDKRRNFWVERVQEHQDAFVATFEQLRDGSSDMARIASHSYSSTL